MTTDDSNIKKEELRQKLVTFKEKHPEKTLDWFIEQINCSKSSLERIFRDKNYILKARPTTLNNIQNFITKYVEEDLSMSKDAYLNLNTNLKIEQSRIDDFIKDYSGTYLCYRLIDKANTILVTKMKIFKNNNGLPWFAHSENEASKSMETLGYFPQHEGAIYPTNHGAMFFNYQPGTAGNLRLIKAVYGFRKNTPTFHGILLTINDSLHNFAAKTFMHRESGGFEDFDVGSYSITIKQLQWVREHIDNDTSKTGVLLIPNT